MHALTLEVVELCGGSKSIDRLRHRQLEHPAIQPLAHRMLGGKLGLGGTYASDRA